MKRLVVFLALMPCLLGACVTTEVVSFERDELVAVQHNTKNDYTLLIYRDPLGQTRHVLRRHGIFELVLTYLSSGEIALRERGCPQRKIEALEAHRLTRHINNLLQVKEKSEEQLSSI